jgi:hypothetical protein
MDTKKLLTEWSTSAAMIRKPKLGEACDVISSLCMEVFKLEGEVKYQKNRQDLKEQEYKTMIIEIQNVVQKYT